MTRRRPELKSDRRALACRAVAVVAGLAALAAPAGGARAADGSPPGPAPYPVRLQVGQVFEVCKTGQVICPIVRHICDDLKVVDLVQTPDGLGIKGVGPGTTLCVASGTTGTGLLLRITVRPPRG